MKAFIGFDKHFDSINRDLRKQDNNMHLEFQKHREVLAEYEVKMEDMSVEGMERERVHQANLTIVERVEKESKACLE